MTNTQQGRATFREPTVTFPAVRGVQAGREYYTTMCPLSLVPRLFFFDEEEVRPELRAQRSLNRARVPEIARYILHNPDSYTFSALTASIDGDAQFVPIDGDANYNVGHLTMALGTPLLINDGQHRRKAIEEALAHRPELGSESIPVVFFLDAGLERSQQMFADLNTHAVRPSQSIGILYNHRDPVARLAKELARLAPVFAGRIEMEKTSISNRSTKLFTLSAVYQATSALLRKAEGETVGADERQLAIAYWTRLGFSQESRSPLQKSELTISMATASRCKHLGGPAQPSCASIVMTGGTTSRACRTLTGGAPMGRSGRGVHSIWGV
jgi:DNA sulfur modification protein DndB